MATIPIALNTFKEARRNKLFYVFLAFAVIMIIASRAIAWVSAGADLKLIVDIGLSAILFFSVIMAIFSGTTLVIKEMEYQSLYTVLSKPIYRRQYIMGKYVGLAITVGVSVALMSVFLTGYYWLMALVLEGSSPPIMPMLIACFFIFIEMVMLIAIAVFFSLVSSPILSAVFTFCAFVVGHGIRALPEMADWLDQLENIPGRLFLKKALMVLYYILPNLDNLDFKIQAVHHLPMTGPQLLYPLIYAVFYSAVLISISIVIFNRKRL